MTGKCKTCRWWEREQLNQAEVTKVQDWFRDGGLPAWIEENVGRCTNEELETYRNNLRFRIDIGVGECWAMPETIRNILGDHRCGQWRERE